MRTLTHRFFAASLAPLLTGGPLLRSAFRLGCVEPDLNFFTHIARSSPRVSSRAAFPAPLSEDSDPASASPASDTAAKKWGCNGHDVPVIERKITRLLGKLLSGKRRGTLFFFRLGVLIHYLTDAFTFAHNTSFDGTLADHVEYENRFHLYFVNRLPETAFTPRDGAPFDFRALHDDYLSAPSAFSTDYGFILDASLSALSALRAI